MPTGFPRQGYWSQWSFPSPGDLPDPGIKPTSPALAGRFFTTDPHGKPTCIMGSPHVFPVIVLFIEYFQQLFLVFGNVIVFLFLSYNLAASTRRKKGLCGIRADSGESAALTCLCWLTALWLLGQKKSFQNTVTKEKCSSSTKLFRRRNQLLLAEVGFFSGISSIQGLCQKIFVLNLECWMHAL